MLLCGSVVRVGAVSLPPRDMRGTSESAAPVILHPSSPSPSPVIDDWIRDNDSHRDPLQEGGHYADMVGEPQIQPSMWWLTIRQLKENKIRRQSCNAVHHFLTLSPWPSLLHIIEKGDLRGKITASVIHPSQINRTHSSLNEDTGPFTTFAFINQRENCEQPPLPIFIIFPATWMLPSGIEGQDINNIMQKKKESQHMHKSTAAAYDVLVLADGSRPFFSRDYTAIRAYSCWKTSLFKAEALRQTISPEHCEHSKCHYWPGCENCQVLWLRWNTTLN